MEYIIGMCIGAVIGIIVGAGIHRHSVDTAIKLLDSLQDEKKENK